MRFRAFLSYSHADAAWARWLLRRLETYRVPSRLVGTTGLHGVIESRLGIFCRDREELASSGDLGATIHEALADSATLIVICSPAAAQSRWVNAEIEAFRGSGRSDRVLCFVVAGIPGSVDPEQSCFPPSLVQTDANGVSREPLAADARRDGDGRERAFLKLVAGLLGVGYDVLARREVQRRNRRLTAVTLASLSGMGIALALAGAAYVARNDAQRRQAQAEDILGFMLGDLREKLTTVGRLDLMRAVDAKATNYFAALNPRDLSDRALEEQARSLTGIGQVRLGEGNHDAAMTAFREAHARSTALYERAPDKGQRLFDLAQAEYWIGFVAWQQGRLDDAGVWLRRYRDSAIRLAPMDRGNFAWQQEVAWGYHNLAVLDDSRGRYQDAERGMREVLALRRAWSKQRPTDSEARGSLADTVSWLGSLSAQQGKLAKAEDFFTEEVAAIALNAANEPLNATWKKEQTEALLLLAKVQMQRGRADEARTSIAAALPLGMMLARQDPSNSDWQVTAGICHWWQAQLAATGNDAAAASSAAAQAAATLVRSHAAEPENERIRAWLAKAYHLQAQLALSRGDAATARARLSESANLLEAAWRAHPNESMRQLQGERLVLSGEAAQLAGDRTGAQADWLQAKQLLVADASAGLPFDRLDPLVRSLHHLGLPQILRPHQQRLAAAGYMPLRPWPWPPSTTVAAH